ncbi:proteasome subunit beta type-2-A-like [Olea europaea var. sylvestris]|uniref:proteasome subunit beta type-2-A-like n=1 Tax=Olea europaea var. sylvestris TaxID=158386 RepID=UPI000C1D7AC9|nr:proteasome subunit beta type-2-A-like [Olea europaea var. sylvestris]
MESVFGLVGKDFAIVAADSSAVHSILVHKTNEDKIMLLDSHKLMGASGETGDRAQFTEYIQKNVALYQFRNGIPLTTAAAANFTRGELVTALRKVQRSSRVNIGSLGFFNLFSLFVQYDSTFLVFLHWNVETHNLGLEFIKLASVLFSTMLKKNSEKLSLLFLWFDTSVRNEDICPKF